MIPPHATGEATRITPEMENPGTHQPGTLHKANLPAEPRSLWDPFGFVCDPKYGSWLNVTEYGFSVPIRQCLDRHIEDFDTVESRRGNLDAMPQRPRKASRMAIHHRGCGSNAQP